VGILRKINVKDPAGTRFAEQFAQAQTLHQQGRLASARQIYLQILDAQSDHFGALNAMGTLSAQSGDLQQAIRFFDRAIAVGPGNSGAHRNLGLALKQLRQLDAALACFDRAIALDANSAIAHYCRAETCRDLGRIDAALASYGAAVAINPGFAEANYSRGVLLHQQARLDAAIASYDQVIRVKPDHFEAHANKALSLYSLGKHAEALASYDRAIALRRDLAPIYVHRGNVLRELHRFEEALASYDQAIAIDPGHAEAICNRGAVLLALDRVEAAIASFDRAIAIKADYAEAYFNRGYALRIMNRFEEAAASYRGVAELAPDFEFLPGARLEASQQICDWTGVDALVGQISAGIENVRRVSHPLILMALIDSPRLQHQAARSWVSHACPPRDSLGPIAPRARPARLRIGYFSADFHEHPLSRLLAELIEIHDRSRFEVIAFAFGPNTHDEVRQRLERSFDEFIEVQARSNLEIAALARRLNVDIAVDLCGHAYNNRSGIFALRAAPLQVNYLGYLGTMGASYIDYIVADRIVVTADSESHFSEKIVYLPDCFQVNDRKRRIADEIYTRERLGLPASGFVFCCFNTNYKIMPATFAAWMRILKSVPGSVLLLYAGHDAVKTNLRMQAARHEVDPQRLIFGERLQPPEYLARYRAADLFLDTLPYNGGATASDALWAGLPVLTLAGEAFASRVAASLLTAVDLPELIATTQQRYEELAIELALNPERLAQIRTRLRENRLTGPLFDTPRLARNLEAAYTAIHDRYQAGLPPDHIRL
jgi:predicted O-linked N-acetylglucosamine transferase (SPINDLY family)